MESWVRYSIAVYVGLLISGALARQPWNAPAAEPTFAPSVYHEATPAGEPLPIKPEPPRPAKADVSV